MGTPGGLSRVSKLLHQAGAASILASTLLLGQVFAAADAPTGHKSTGMGSEAYIPAPAGTVLPSHRYGTNGPLVLARTDFIWPASGVISQNAAQHKANENTYAEDIANSGAPPVYAAYDGTVTFAGTTSDQYYCALLGRNTGGDGFGNFVVIRHDGGSTTYYTLYAHLSSWSVTAGQVIRQGIQIGVMGNTGCSTGTHTHFEIGTCTSGVYVASPCTLWLAPDPIDGTAVTEGTPTGGNYPGLGSKIQNLNYRGNTIYWGDQSVVTESGSRLYAFVGDQAGHLQENSWNGSAWVWGDHGLPPNPNVTVVRVVGTSYVGDNNVANAANSRLYVYVQGSDGHLYLSTWQGSAWVWADQGVPAAGVTVTGGVGTIYYGDNNVANMAGSRLHVFVWGSNGHLYDDTWQGSGWVWTDQGVPAAGVTVTGGVGTIYYGDSNAGNAAGSRLHAFLWGSDGHLYDDTWQGSAYVWTDQGVPAAGVTVTGGVGTIYFGDNNAGNVAGSRLHAFLWGTDGHLYDDTWQGSAYVWTDQGVPAAGVTVAGGVGTIYFGDNNAGNAAGSRLHAFALGSNSHLYDDTWQGSSWIWGDQLQVP